VVAVEKNGVSGVKRMYVKVIENATSVELKKSLTNIFRKKQKYLLTNGEVILH
jgi:hypothetical protein